MENKKRQGIKTEFYTFTGNNPAGPSQFNLVIDKPCEIIFFANRIGAIGGPTRIVNINNNYLLNAFNCPEATRLYPYELRLRCNLGEVDTTIYQITVDLSITCTVIARFYENLY
jgi:hypothetical protein